MKTTSALSPVVFSFVLGSTALGAQIVGDTNRATASLSSGADYRLKWNMLTLVGAYEQRGRHNPKWDEAAKAALATFAQVRAATNPATALTLSGSIADSVKTAVTKGCDDPLILYLRARFVLPSEAHSGAEHAEAYRLSAEGMVAGSYPPIRTFYAALHTSEMLNPGGNQTPQEVHRWRREANKYLDEAVRDKNMPVGEVYDAGRALLEAVQHNKQQFEEFYRDFEPVILTNWPSESSLYLLKGWFYTKYAWHARGSDYADKVTDQGWTLFAERLAQAEKALSTAWELNPHDERIALEMITVELGQGKGRPRMELWFKRATDLNPDYYDAFASKLYYLEPKWYGSREDMLEFGRECVASKKWGGHVPLILRDAHESLARYLPKEQQTTYWRDPEVWKDLKSAFDKYFELNPQDGGWHHNYALYAYRAGQWEDLNRQIPLLGPINYDFFGGKEAFDQMVRQAKAHAGK